MEEMKNQNEFHFTHIALLFILKNHNIILYE